MASRKRKRKEQAPGWAWMLFGLSLGLGVALVVYLKSGPPVTPSPAERQAAAARRIPEAGPRDETASPAAAPAGGAAATDGPAEAEAEAEAEADLEFYELLREIEVDVPDSAPPAERTPVEYTIQAGSFQTFAEADRRKARLALLGIDSAIVNAIVGNDIWHRVIIGPLGEPDEINRVLRQLRNEDIDSLTKPVPD